MAHIHKYRKKKMYFLRHVLTQTQLLSISKVTRIRKRHFSKNSLPRRTRKAWLFLKNNYNKVQNKISTPLGA